MNCRYLLKSHVVRPQGHRVILDHNILREKSDKAISTITPVINCLTQQSLVKTRSKLMNEKLFVN